MEIIKGGVCAPKGFKAAGIHCGIRKNRQKRDLALIWSEAPAAAAAVVDAVLTAYLGFRRGVYHKPGKRRAPDRHEIKPE